MLIVYRKNADYRGVGLFTIPEFPRVPSNKAILLAVIPALAVVVLGFVFADVLMRMWGNLIKEAYEVIWLAP